MQKKIKQKIGKKRNDLLIKQFVRNQRVMSDNDLITTTAKKGEKKMKRKAIDAIR